jgi:VPDSG-CTERM motif
MKRIFDNSQKCLALTVAIAALTCCSLSATTVLAPGASWEYQFGVQPNTSWTTVSGGWTVGNAPFGNVSSGDFGYNTYWPADSVFADYELSVRTTVNLTGFDLNTLHYDLGVDNGYNLYVNGNLVSGDNAGGYTFRWEYSGAIPAGYLLPGNNIIAVSLDDYGGLTAFDLQLTATESASVPDGGATVGLLGLGLMGLASLRRWI